MLCKSFHTILFSEQQEKVQIQVLAFQFFFFLKLRLVDSTDMNPVGMGVGCTAVSTLEWMETESILGVPLLCAHPVIP